MAFCAELAALVIRLVRRALLCLVATTIALLLDGIQTCVYANRLSIPATLRHLQPHYSQ